METLFDEENVTQKSLKSLGRERIDEITRTTPWVCPKGHHLDTHDINQLSTVKYFYTIGGFVCVCCKVSSDNLVEKKANICQECGPNQAVFCTSCAAKFRKELAKKQALGLMEQEKRNNLINMAQNPNSAL